MRKKRLNVTVNATAVAFLKGCTNVSGYLEHLVVEREAQLRRDLKKLRRAGLTLTSILTGASEFNRRQAVGEVLGFQEGTQEWDALRRLGFELAGPNSGTVLSMVSEPGQHGQKPLTVAAARKNVEVYRRRPRS